MWWPISVGVLCTAIVAAQQPSAPSLHRAARRIMGTFCEVQVYHEDASVATRAVNAALDEMARVDRLLSNYDPDSELSAMNREASHSSFRASQELFDFVAACQRYAQTTGGAFDPTVGALVRAWGFFSKTPSRPSAAALADAKQRVGIDKVRLDPGTRSVTYTAPGLEIDPGGIGKGYAVDRAAEILRKMGVRAALVSAGGSTLYGLGRPPGRAGWRVGINNPSDPAHAFGYVQLHDNALSTSGSSEQSVVLEGHRYSHVFDPRSGDPVADMCQATVVALTATDSDALGKPAFVLSRDGARAVLSGRAGVHVMRVEGACEDRTRPWIAPWSGGVFEVAL
jgi:thiamine biosynthesis lipoprotein